MKDNKTSQAVAEELTRGTLAPRYQAICEKYKRMEEALEWIRTNPTAYIQDQQKKATEALSFDPL